MHSTRRDGSPTRQGDGVQLDPIDHAGHGSGVSGAGLATLAGGLQAHRPEMLDGVGLIVGIDRFMSEARAVTNFSGNAVATLLVGSWTGTVDKARVHSVLRGEDPFNEDTMLDEDQLHLPGADEDGTAGKTPATAGTATA